MKIIAAAIAAIALTGCGTGYHAKTIMGVSTADVLYVGAPAANFQGRMMQAGNICQPFQRYSSGGSSTYWRCNFRTKYGPKYTAYERAGKIVSFSRF